MFYMYKLETGVDLITYKFKHVVVVPIFAISPALPQRQLRGNVQLPQPSPTGTVQPARLSVPRHSTSIELRLANAIP